MKRFASLIVLAVVVLASLTTPLGVSASHDDASCGDLTVVFARGSGQGLNGRETKKFFGSISDRLGDDIRLNAYELGTEAHGGKSYRAVGIGFDSTQSFKNLLESDASWTGSAGGKYRASVSDGVTELKSYLEARSKRCKDELFVVGGYSQGAQVVGDALPKVSRSVRDKIAHVALFGDPKLYLPEGRGPFPPACRGKGFSKWRRGNVSCFTDNGILEARKPYLPSDIEARTGSWCDRNDPICNNNFADFVVSAHGYYAEDGAEIDEAVLEIVKALAGRWPEKAASLDVSVIFLGTGTAGTDVAFVIDSTGSMSGRIGAAKAIASTFGTTVVDSLRGRVALTEYRDAGDTFVAEVRTPLSNDLGPFRSALSAMTADGGGDEPEALLAALMTTFDSLSWTPGATKAAIVLTDATYHDPDKATGDTVATVAARALEIDPVNVYPVVPGGLADFYETLAGATSGQVIVDEGDTEDALLKAISEISLRPTVLFVVDDFFAAVGDEITFDASRSYDPDSEIVSFEWDFDGDGIIDQSGPEPIASHTFTDPFSGMVEVRVRSADGGISNGVVNVDVSADGLGDLLPSQPKDVALSDVGVADGGRTARLSWTAPVGGGEVQSFRAIGPDGALLGVSSGTSISMPLAALPSEETAITLVSSNAYGSSDGVMVVLPTEATTTTSSTSTTTTTTTTTTTAPVTSTSSVPTSPTSTMASAGVVQDTPRPPDADRPGTPVEVASKSALAFTGAETRTLLLLGIALLLGGIAVFAVVRRQGVPRA